jgi:glycosyltransferase involved in cell wall biosynthesis
MSGQGGTGQPEVVLFVNNSMAMGGIETMIRDFALGLRADGFRPAVAVFQPGGQLAEQLTGQGVPVTNLAKRDGLDLGLVGRLRRHIRDIGASVVHCHNYSAWLYSTLATWGLPGVRLVHSEHSRVLPLPRRRWLERQLARRTHAVVAVSADVARCLVRDIGVAPERVCLVANGIDLARFKPDPALRAGERARLGLPEAAIAFGILARLVPVKDHATLLQAFALAAQRLPQAHLVIAGDGPCRPALELQARDLDLQDRIHFLGEVRDGERVLNALDVYMLSSVDEGMNLTLLEAMGTGLPAIATRVGGNPEVVQDGSTGLVVPPSQPQAMAEAMVRLAEDPVLRQRLARQARERVAAAFSQQVTLQAYVALYRGAPPQPWKG